jgi:hypothetical protein
MTPKEKIESYLMKLSLTYQEADANAWLVSDPEKGLFNLLVMAVDPLLLIRVDVMEVPEEGRAKLFEELLRLNAKDMVHGAYGIDGKTIVILDSLELETLDIEEFQASIDAIGLALAQHFKVFAAYRTAK